MQFNEFIQGPVAAVLTAITLFVVIIGYNIIQHSYALSAILWYLGIGESIKAIDGVCTPYAQISIC